MNSVIIRQFIISLSVVCIVQCINAVPATGKEYNFIYTSIAKTWGTKLKFIIFILYLFSSSLYAYFTHIHGNLISRFENIQVIFK